MTALVLLTTCLALSACAFLGALAKLNDAQVASCRPSPSGKSSCLLYSMIRMECYKKPSSPLVTLATVCSEETLLTHPGGTCQSSTQQNFTINFSSVWRTKEGRERAGDIRNVKLHVCLYPTKNQESLHPVSMSVRGYAARAGSSTARKVGGPASTTFNTTSRYCGWFRKPCQKSDVPADRYAGECVWRRVDVAKAVRKALRAGQTKVTFQVKLDTVRAPQTCYSFFGNDDHSPNVLKRRMPFVSFLYRHWKPITLPTSDNSPSNPFARSLCSYKGECGLRAVSLNASILAQTSSGFGLSDQGEESLNGGDFTYHICAGTCHASTDTQQTLADVMKQPESACQTIYKEKPLKFHGMRKFETFQETRLFQQWTAQECRCFRGHTNGTRAAELPVPADVPVPSSS